MSLYTITIEPNDEGRSGDTSFSQAIVRIDTAGSTPRVVELAVKSSAPNGLGLPSLPSIDFSAIVTALQARFHPSGDSSSRLQTESREVNTSNLAGIQNPAKAGPDRRGGGRAYRRMPDADEVRTAYKRIGTVTGLANEYGVPRHTAQGWMSRIRKLDKA